MVENGRTMIYQVVVERSPPRQKSRWNVSKQKWNLKLQWRRNTVRAAAVTVQGLLGETDTIWYILARRARQTVTG